MGGGGVSSTQQLRGIASGIWLMTGEREFGVLPMGGGRGCVGGNLVVELEDSESIRWARK